MSKSKLLEVKIKKPNNKPVKYKCKKNYEEYKIYQ